jgi:hypothetical protein
MSQMRHNIENNSKANDIGAVRDIFSVKITDLKLSSDPSTHSLSDCFFFQISMYFKCMENHEREQYKRHLL